MRVVTRPAISSGGTRSAPASSFTAPSRRANMYRRSFEL
jgi:hypothetical protein